MHLFPYRRVRLSKGRWLWVSRYPMKEPYDVKGRPDSKYDLMDFIPVKYPGCGFFVHKSNSHSYQRSVRAYQEPFMKKYSNLLFPKMPSLNKIIEQGEQAARTASDTMYMHLYETYVTQLMLAREEDQLAHMREALHRKMRTPGHHRYSADRKDCKRALRNIESRRKITFFDSSRYYTPEQLEAYGRMVDAFKTMMHIHYIWDMRNQNDGNERSRVFFELGAICYIYQPHPIPMMRDAKNRLFILLPDRVLNYRTPFDFDTHMLNTLDIRFGALGDGVQSEMMIAQLSLLYRFSSVRRVENFVQAWKQLQDLVKEQ